MNTNLFKHFFVFIFLLITSCYAVIIPLDIVDLLDAAENEIIFTISDEESPLFSKLKGKLTSSPADGPFTAAVSFQSKLPPKMVIDALADNLLPEGRGLIAISPLESTENTILAKLKKDHHSWSASKIKRYMHHRNLKIVHSEYFRRQIRFESEEAMTAWIKTHLDITDDALIHDFIQEAKDLVIDEKVLVFYFRR